MLVLTRRPGEAIIIANNIKVTVVSVGPGRVKLGIEAPPEVRVDRQEIHEKIEQSSDVLAAVGSVPTDVQGTLVGGPDTESLSAPVVVNAPAAAAPPVPALPVGKLDKYRLPRKPR